MKRDGGMEKAEEGGAGNFPTASGDYPARSTRGGRRPCQGRCPCVGGGGGGFALVVKRAWGAKCARPGTM